MFSIRIRRFAFEASRSSLYLVIPGLGGVWKEAGEAAVWSKWGEGHHC